MAFALIDVPHVRSSSSRRTSSFHFEARGATGEEPPQPPFIGTVEELAIGRCSRL